MEITQKTGKCVAIISDNDYSKYGDCPNCEKELSKKVFNVDNHYWGRLFCPNCEWTGLQCGLDSAELDPVTSYLQTERNKLNREISKLKKANLKQFCDCGATEETDKFCTACGLELTSKDLATLKN